MNPVPPVDQPAIARWWAAHKALWAWNEAQEAELFRELDFYGIAAPDGDAADPDADPALHRYMAWLPEWTTRLEAHQERFRERLARLDAEYTHAQAGHFDPAWVAAQLALMD